MTGLAFILEMLVTMGLTFLDSEMTSIRHGY